MNHQPDQSHRIAPMMPMSRTRLGNVHSHPTRCDRLSTNVTSKNLLAWPQAAGDMAVANKETRLQNQIKKETVHALEYDRYKFLPIISADIAADQSVSADISLLYLQICRQGPYRQKGVIICQYSFYLLAFATHFCKEIRFLTLKNADKIKMIYRQVMGVSAD